MADIKKEVLDFNLNGTDWSNLYHVDYSGGTGGERLAEAIATKVNAGDFLVEYNHGINHENINYGIKLDVLRDILIENNVKFNEGRKYWFKPSQEQVAQLAKESTVLINCYK